ncbi:MAG: heme A synthase, partial [Winogradskyella sp.]|nr:COX15/CtaA family protein [Winogradskyella sp.]NNF86359.1 heme A synthase [Winogradskyella sp.]NNK39495.1 heme A synthase [Winogradskyella sp.]NNL83045.1 heme A synthase [Winogradskyella sp.]
YINRLIGAASGIPILIFTIMSIWLWKDRKRFLILSILTVFAMAFQAWLGKTVVDSNLAPYKITVHMVMALVIVAIILYLIFIAKETTKHQRYDKGFRHIMVFATLLTLVQIILGTQVRQYVDEQVKDIGYIKSQWLADPTVSFYVHRTLSLLVLAVNGWLFYRNKTLNLGYTKLNIVLIGIGLEIITGILMYYFDFPFSTQPTHLVLAAILIGVQFYLVLESNQKKINVNRIEFEKS